MRGSGGTGLDCQRGDVTSPAPARPAPSARTGAVGSAPLRLRGALAGWGGPGLIDGWTGIGPRRGSWVGGFSTLTPSEPRPGGRACADPPPKTQAHRPELTGSDRAAGRHGRTP